MCPLQVALSEAAQARGRAWVASLTLASFLVITRLSELLRRLGMNDASFRTSSIFSWFLKGTLWFLCQLSSCCPLPLSTTELLSPFLKEALRCFVLRGSCLRGSSLPGLGFNPVLIFFGWWWSLPPSLWLWKPVFREYKDTGH